MCKICVLYFHADFADLRRFVFGPKAHCNSRKIRRIRVICVIDFHADLRRFFLNQKTYSNPCKIRCIRVIYMTDFIADFADLRRFF
ncbi:hypothetical protein FPG59_01695 [Flavobacterium sp. FPG59]|nr:hypothetical protein FPG59_01695 [Flavobacterium sp. FPG59]